MGDNEYAQQPLKVFIKSRLWVPVVIILLIVGLLSYARATTNPKWLDDFSANLAADTLVAVVLGMIITMYFQSSRETAERQARQREAYRLLKEELDKNLKDLGDLREAWLQNKLRLFAFQTGRGEVILQESGILGEDLALVSLLFNTYDEIRFFNRYYAIVLEEPIRRGKFELDMGLQRITLKDEVDNHLERLAALIVKALEEIA